MTKAPREPVPRRTGYHHGNLKEALITAARRLIAERGPLGFTLVEAARLANVSPAAPYRHFKDRDALLAEVRARGAGAFATRLESAWRSAASDPASAFQRMGEAYLSFAREEPGYYAAMFSSGLGPRQAKSAKKKDASFAMLMQAIERVMPARSAAADPELVAFLVWALSHGVATLSAAGQLPDDKDGAKARATLKAGVGALMRGLAAKGGASGMPAIAGGGTAPEAGVRKRSHKPRKEAGAKPAATAIAATPIATTSIATTPIATPGRSRKR